MQKLAEICIRRPVFATMLVMMLVVLGLDSYRKLGVDLMPKVEFPYVTVTTVLRGASPEEVETQLTKRIEEAVNTISGIDELMSTSAEGLSRVTIAFVLEKDVEVAAQEVRDKISSIAGELPRDAEQSTVEKLSTDAGAVVNVVVSSPRDLRETTKLVDDKIKKNIETISGVGQVRFVGDRTRQIQVVLDGEKLYSYNLNIDQVRAALVAQNVEIPGGRVEQGSRELSLRTLGRVERPEDFNEIIVANLNGTPIRIKDIGIVKDGIEEPRSLARLNGKEAVVLEVRKQSGTNTIDVIDGVKNRIAELKATLPGDFVISYLGDQSGFIKASFHAVQEHLILGGILAALIVFIFIRDWRSTLISAIAIPTSIIATYTLMYAMGFTLNTMSMLALTLMVGIVIDDAIVVLENVFRFLEEKHMTPFEAAMMGTRDIGLAVLATTLSLAVVFLPVAMMPGIVGRFMSSFGYTAAFAIMVSLLVSFTMTPMLCSRFLREAMFSGKQHQNTKDTWLFKLTAAPYRAMLEWSMRHRWVIVSVSVLVMLSTVPLFMMIGKDFLPADDQSAFDINVRLPAGSSLDGTNQALIPVEDELRKLPGVRDVMLLIGSDLRRQVDRAAIRVELVDPKERNMTQKEVMELARVRLRKFHDMVIAVNLPSMIQGMGANQDFQFFVQGPDLVRLNTYARAVMDRLAKMPGVADLDTTYESGKPELRVRINRDKAADLNVSVSSIATALRTLVGGDDQVTTYREGEDRYDVQLRVEQRFRNSEASLNRLFVPSSSLGNVPVSNVANLLPAEGPINIDHYNRQRQVQISASIIGDQALGNVVAEAEKAVAELKMPPEYRSGTVGRSRELGRAATNFGIAFLLSLIFMYMILASQFESFLDPITILISLPLSVPFAVLSLLVFKENFSIIYSSVGILVLFGIVKKNSILQIDHIKNLRRDGMPRLEAILKGCEDRLRPILMTTAALVAGMLPLALGTGAGAGTRRTVAIAVIGGQTLCLLLTLLVTPVTYSLFDDLSQGRLFAGFRTSVNGGLRRAWGTVNSLLPLLLCAILIGQLVVAPVQAQELASNPLPVAPPRIGVGIIEKKLALAEAIEMALKNNLEIEIERTQTAVARQQIKAALGAFDPTFRYQPSLETRNTPAASVLQGPGGVLTEHFNTQDFHFLQKAPFGTNFNVDFANQRLSTTNPFTSLSPYTTSRLVLGFTQPLFRGREIDRERAELRIRRKQADVADTDFETRVIDVLQRVEQAYWDLVSAREAASVSADGVRLGEEQLARNQRMIQAGVLAPVELSAAQAELERRRETWLQSLALITDTENAIKSLVAPDRTADIWNDIIIPTDQSVVEPPEVTDLRKTVDMALSRRPEIKRVSQLKESNDIQSELNRNLTKPMVNLVAGYANSGLAGSIRPGENPFAASNQPLYDRINLLSTQAGIAPLPISSFGSTPENLIGGYGSTLNNLFSGRYNTLQAGLQLDLNLRNRAAEANLAQSAINERRLKLEQARASQLIEAQVRSALQALDTSKQRIKAAQASADAAKERLDSELRLFQTGESTNFLVLTRQNELLDSRRRVVVARLDLNRAVSRLEQALGNTLESHKVTLTPSGPTQLTK